MIAPHRGHSRLCSFCFFFRSRRYLPPIAVSPSIASTMASGKTPLHVPAGSRIGHRITSTSPSQTRAAKKEARHWLQNGSPCRAIAMPSALFTVCLCGYIDGNTYTALWRHLIAKSLDGSTWEQQPTVGLAATSFTGSKQIPQMRAAGWTVAVATMCRVALWAG